MVPKVFYLRFVHGLYQDFFDKKKKINYFCTWCPKNDVKLGKKKI